MNKNKKEHEKEFLNTNGLAEYLNVSCKAISKWTQNRRLPVVKIGRLNRYRRIEIEQRLLGGKLLLPIDKE